MTKKKTPAKADKKASVKAGPITGARLVQVPRDGLKYPAAIYRGDKPSKGSKISLKMKNGTTYEGLVHDSTEADGEVLVEFRDGLTPLDIKR